jgi:N-acetyl-anhydromuramyl-L-alanine amidase AmpD
MQVVTSKRSPNFTDLAISVEYVVVHYTAASLERTLEIFMNPAAEVSAHIVIDRDGTVHELVPCFDGSALRAWHAGKSRLEVRGGSLVEGFNDRSIGIELVNFNGNIIPYTEAQYGALFKTIERLKGIYPALSRPESIVGHEQIAGFRGKCDPGLLFEWGRLFSVCYPDQGMPARPAICPPQVAARLSGLVKAVGGAFDPVSGETKLPPMGEGVFSHLSSLLESALSRDDR